jgi:hypothetical protein
MLSRSIDPDIPRCETISFREILFMTSDGLNDSPIKEYEYAAGEMGSTKFEGHSRL